MDIYCVVTGQDESGKSVIIRNTPIKPVSLAFLRATSFIAYGEAIPSLNFRRTGLCHCSLAISPPRVVPLRVFHYTAGYDDKR